MGQSIARLDSRAAVGILFNEEKRVREKQRRKARGKKAGVKVARAEKVKPEVTEVELKIPSKPIQRKNFEKKQDELLQKIRTRYARVDISSKYANSGKYSLKITQRGRGLHTWGRDHPGEEYNCGMVKLPRFPVHPYKSYLLKFYARVKEGSVLIGAWNTNRDKKWRRGSGADSFMTETLARSTKSFCKFVNGLYAFEKWPEIREVTYVSPTFYVKGEAWIDDISVEEIKDISSIPLKSYPPQIYRAVEQLRREGKISTAPCKLSLSKSLITNLVNGAIKKVKDDYLLDRHEVANFLVRVDRPGDYTFSINVKSSSENKGKQLILLFNSMVIGRVPLPTGGKAGEVKKIDLIPHYLSSGLYLVKLIGSLYAPTGSVDSIEVKFLKKRKLPLFSFLHFNDSHYSPLKWIRAAIDNPLVVESCLEVVKKMEPLPKFVLMAGDAVESSIHKEAIKRLVSDFDRFKDLGIKWYMVTGNHDPIGEDPERCRMFGNALPGPPKHPTYYSFNLYGFHFVALDTNYRIDKEGVKKDELGLGMPLEEIEWAKKDLSRNRNKPVILFFHQPGFGVINRDQLLSIFTGDNYPNIIAAFVGHGHSFCVSAPRDILNICGNAMGEHTPGFSEVLVYENELRIRAYLVPNLGLLYEYYHHPEADFELLHSPCMSTDWGKDFATYHVVVKFDVKKGKKKCYINGSLVFVIPKPEGIEDDF